MIEKIPQKTHRGKNVGNRKWKQTWFPQNACIENIWQDQRYSYKNIHFNEFISFWAPVHFFLFCDHWYVLFWFCCYEQIAMFVLFLLLALFWFHLKNRPNCSDNSTINAMCRSRILEQSIRLKRLLNWMWYFIHSFWWSTAEWMKY